MGARRHWLSKSAGLVAALIALAALPWGCADVIGADFDKPFQATGGAGQGAGGGAAGCVKAAECAGAEGECGHPACKSGLCAFEALVEGTAAATQTTGDCLIRVCDGKGGVQTRVDEGDAPSDGNDCTLETCANGSPVSAPAPAKTPCGPSGKLTCNGAGVCTGCDPTVQGECGASTDCLKWTCNPDHSCSQTFAPGGTVVADPQPGDCKALHCNGAGATETVADDTDAPKTAPPCFLPTCIGGVASYVEAPPPNDGNPCTADSCDKKTGAEVHKSVNEGNPCSGGCSRCSAGSCLASCPGGEYCAGGGCQPQKNGGEPCGKDAECSTGHCSQDHVCCDAACNGCDACTQSATGQPDGTCAPVKLGGDPNHACAATPGDTCDGQGACLCHNSKQDAGETGVDCGNATCGGCTTWHCGGCAIVAGDCCDQCKSCSPPDDTSCTQKDGSPCAPGSQDLMIKAGPTADDACPKQKHCQFRVCKCTP